MTRNQVFSLPSTEVSEPISTFRVEVSRRVAISPTKSKVGTSWDVINLFFLRGRLTTADVQRIAAELLADSVTESFAIYAVGSEPPHTSASHIVDVTLLPGVTDSAAENLIKAAQWIGITTLEQAAVGQRYLIHDPISASELRRLAVEVFSNPVIQHFTIDQPIMPPFVPYQQSDGTVESISLRSADDDRLLAISAERRLSLDLAEMQAIRTYFQREARDPSDVELEMLAQTWSEHCIHKTFKAIIDYIGPDSDQPQMINGLLRTYIRGATEQIAKPWVQSAFVDNAGVISFDNLWDVAFKVETHNHPSALEPFGGANTGVGGVVRDILGVSARPIANTDILCFGPQDLPDGALPAGVLHPRRIAEGVIHGVEDYGNKMGIPTINGAILYHPGYTSNPLVFCGCLGILPHGSHVNAPQAGDLIVVIGGRTGRDGLRGATFSSMEMDQTTSEIAGSAVQIGHPIHEKQVLEVVLRARDAKLYHAITDCGAGGLSSAVGEMAQMIGARVQLESVPLKYPGLRPWEIWLSEAQERMVLAVPPEQWPQFQAICAGQEVEAISIGTLEPTGHLQLYYGDRLVGDLAMQFLHDGIPQRHLKAIWKPAQPFTPKINVEPIDLAQSLLALLAHPNIRSKESIIRRYDHEVQGATVVKPLVGIDSHGPGDAAVLLPLDVNLQESLLPIKELIVKSTAVRPLDSHFQDQTRSQGIALAVGICPAYGELDPYVMAWAAVDEALRNLVAIGADPDRVALLDNFCWGNANLPDRLGSLVRCSQGCYDAAMAYGTPFISGKDSLNNEYADQDGQRHAIPGTLLISALGLVPDVRQVVTMDLKHSGNALYIIGMTRAELGGSHYGQLSGRSNAIPPHPVGEAIQTMRVLHHAIQSGLIQACHDCSEGGIGVALAEMCIAGRLGAQLDLASIPGAARIEQDDALLFAESLSRFIVEIKPDQMGTFEILLQNGSVVFAHIGTVNDTDELQIQPRNGQTVIAMPIAMLDAAWCDQLPVALPDQRPNTISPVNRSSLARTAVQRSGPAQVLILHAAGSNRDRDAALACKLAGGEPEIVHINQLLVGERHLSDYHMLVVPGGFSYGDDLGAGKLWALNLQHRLGEAVDQFVASGRPVLGICNGFQVLVKAGLLPGAEWQHNEGQGKVTLTYNALGHFECRWVYLQVQPHSPCLFTEGLTEMIYCPVAHGEGRFVAYDEATLNALWQNGLVALTYVQVDGSPAAYPSAPNGSDWGIAGLCNPAGNVLGLMPHPEDHIFPWQHPRWSRGEGGLTGLRLFENGLKYAK